MSKLCHTPKNKPCTQSTPQTILEKTMQHTYKNKEIKMHEKIYPKTKKNEPLKIEVPSHFCSFLLFNSSLGVSF
jgi:hypothetical protein